ncbi:MAG: hypothetical protein RLY86_3410 [Pseudomonadota bacterium]|jgi:peptidyl-prolyl cis-trans isomerase D
MLQSIRSTVGSWVVKILFILLIVSFAVWGVGDMTTGWVDRSVAKVGDVSIQPEELQEEFRREVNRMREVFGPQFTEVQAQQFGVVDRTLESLVQRALLTQAANDAGLSVGDPTVVEQVRQFEAFRNPLGQFDPEVMRFVLRQNGFTEQAFVELMRADIARNRMVGAVGSGADSPRLLAEALFRHRAERRVADVVTLPVSAMAEPADPDEATVTAYHQDNAVRYTAPEYRTLTVATLTADDLLSGVSVTDEDLREAYETRSDEFITPESRDVVQVVATDEAAARSLVEAVTGGQTLEQAAEAAGLATVDLPASTRETLLPEIVEPVFAAEMGATAGPVQSPFGWHVFIVRSIIPGGERSFEDVREQLAIDVRREKAVDQLFEVANTMDDRLAGGASLEEAAQAVGAKVVALEPVDNSGRTRGGGTVEIPGVPVDTVLERAFAQQAGETSNLIESGDAAYFAVQVAEVVPSALRPLDDVRGQIIADWKADRRKEAATAQAEAFAARLRDGADPAALAAEVPGATYVRTEPLFRVAQEAGPVPPALREAMFGVTAGEVATAPGQGAATVARVVEVIPADITLGASQIEQIRTAMGESVANDIVNQYLNGLRERYPVEINRTAINAIFSPQE